MLLLCPRCGLKQIARDNCRSCGTVLPLETAGGTVLPGQAAAADDNPYASPLAGDQAPVTTGRTAMPLAGLGARLGAALIDGLLNLAAAIPGFFVLIMASFSTRGEDDTMLTIGWVLIGGGILGLNIYQWVILTTDGQSLGKKALNIRIVHHQTGMNPGFNGAVGMRVIVNAVLANIVPFYGLVDILLIFGQEHRCIHDLLAGTIVVENV